ncbi:MAG TPA: hypothetical protein VMR70_08710 [Flavisolibacter sp.]|nr:hypothetical protein [Flavisolibacter sp.]
MGRSVLFLFFCSSLLTLACCQREAASTPGTAKTLFDSVPSFATVTPIINETSGIADSRKNPGFLWAQEDGGNPAQLYLLKHNGTVQKKIVLDNLTNRDWEDMVLLENEIYIGEIGDNNGVYPEYLIYKFPEPASTTDTVRNIETIRFRYTDGPRDAEAFLVDPLDKSIYIITKRDNPSRIYKLTPPFTNATVHTAVQVGQLSMSGIVSAALSPDRKEIILKTYPGLGHFKIGQGESIEAALSKAPTILPYTIEPQGEAVCFSAANNGYFTLSEKAFAPEVRLYFYKRN